MASVLILIPEARLRFPSCEPRRCATQLKAHTAFHQVRDEVLVRIAGCHIPLGVVRLSFNVTWPAFVERPQSPEPWRSSRPRRSKLAEGGKSRLEDPLRTPRQGH